MGYNLGNYGDQLSATNQSDFSGGGGGMGVDIASAAAGGLGSIISGIGGLFKKPPAAPRAKWGDPYQDMAFGELAKNMSSLGDPMYANYLNSAPGWNEKFNRMFGTNLAGIVGQEQGGAPQASNPFGYGQSAQAQNPTAMLQQANPVYQAPVAQNTGYQGRGSATPPLPQGGWKGLGAQQNAQPQQNQMFKSRGF